MDLRPHELVRESDGSFLVHTRAYTDPGVYDVEMRRIFESTWIYVGHESQIPEVGDYITTSAGTQPLIVSRAEDGRIHVLLNRCRHRGSVVCRMERGHSNHFRCPYHSWLYRNDGSLIGVAQQSGYADADRSALGLVPAAAVGVYRGLVFASIAAPRMSLEERLREVAPYIDLWVERSPTGEIRTTTHAHKLHYAGNWKFQMENGNDGYHGNYVHESFMKIVSRAGETTVGDFKRARNAGSVVGLSHGDGFIDRPEGGMAGQFDYHDPRHAGYHQALDDRYGPDRRAEILGQRNLLIFPNLYLFESHIRVISPVSVDCTVVVMQPILLGGVPDAFNVERMRTNERFFGPAGFGSPDDVEMFLDCATGLRARSVDWVVLDRGIAREETAEGRVTGGHTTDEAPQRSAYRAWRELMAEPADG
jgi:phenylpropionate dioxygenase-like ring-hydroxylating dioxygenase large terminal subunit